MCITGDSINEGATVTMKSNSCIKKWAERIVIILLFVFLATVGIICLKGLVVTTDAFMENQRTFNKAYTKATATITSLPLQDQEAAKLAIAHLEQLQTIQKNAASSDVMSFLYSALSTVLVGLCAGFVAKCHKDASKATDAADSAKRHAENVEQFITETVKKTETQMLRQKGMMSIMDILIEIVLARASLQAYDQTSANRRIYNISQLTLALLPGIDRGALLRLQEEELRMKTSVKLYREYAESLPNGGDKTSMLQAADRYASEMDDAVKHIETLLRTVLITP